LIALHDAEVIQTFQYDLLYVISVAKCAIFGIARQIRWA